MRQVVMSEEILRERRRWFQHFPQGSIEFLVGTRMLALLLLVSVLVVRDVQRPAVFIALTGLLWLDYAIVFWWLLQMAMDLRVLSSRGQADPGGLRQGRVRIAVVAYLPSLAAALLLAPWPTLMRFYLSRPGGETETSHPLTQVVYPVLGLMYVGAIAFAFRPVRRLELGSGLWTLLLFVPVLHWLAVHRLMAGLQRRMAAEHGHESHGGLSLAIADVTWVLGVLPWVVVAVVSAVRGWPDQFPLLVAPVCGTGLATVFAVADLAALEQAQKQFIGLIRKQ